MGKRQGFKHQKNFGNGTPMNVQRRKQGARRPASPWGDKPTSERVTAVLGKKPNWATWKQYHAIAQKTPWKLDKYRADAAPLALSSRLFLDPSRPLNEDERAAVKRAHDDLSRGTIDAEGYRAALDALALGIVPSKRRRPKVGA